LLQRCQGWKIICSALPSNRVVVCCSWCQPTIAHGLVDTKNRAWLLISPHLKPYLNVVTFGPCISVSCQQFFHCSIWDLVFMHDCEGKERGTLMNLSLFILNRFIYILTSRNPKHAVAIHYCIHLAVAVISAAFATVSSSQPRLGVSAPHRTQNPLRDLPRSPLSTSNKPLPLHYTTPWRRPGGQQAGVAGLTDRRRRKEESGELRSCPPMARVAGRTDGGFVADWQRAVSFAWPRGSERCLADSWAILTNSFPSEHPMTQVPPTRQWNEPCIMTRQRGEEI
jgi:hypothetical protein